MAGIIPLVLLLNGVEYLITGRILGQRISLAESIRVGILGSAANLLPIPGAVLIRTQALKEGGAGYGAAVRSNAAIAASWVGVSFLLAGAFQVGSNHMDFGILFIALGVGGLMVMAVLMKSSPLWSRLAVVLVGVETLVVVTSALRLYAVLHGMGIEGSMSQSFVLALSVALAAVAGVIPGGLGIREVIAGVLGTLVGLPIAIGIFAASIDRLIGMAILAMTTGIMLASSSTPKAQQGEPIDLATHES